MECPSVDYLDSLVTNSQLLEYTSAHRSDDEHTPCLVVHFTPAEVMASDVYQSWMSRWILLWLWCVKQF